MRLSAFAIMTLLISYSSATAADLTKIDRRIAKEPEYKSKPKYCLLVFGPEAKTRVWLVQDGDTLYVDRNGNGDLTDGGERVELKAAKGRNFPIEVREAAVGDIPDGDRKHTGIELNLRRLHPEFVPQDENEEQLKKSFTQSADGTVYIVTAGRVNLTLHGGKNPFTNTVTQVAGADADGILQFAARPQEAPIIHFGGPLAITLLEEQTLARGKAPNDLRVGVGTPGLGKGSFAFLMYQSLTPAGVQDVIPEDAHPVVEITFPPKSGQEPIRIKITLAQRC
jgi:hypothetical protein